VLLGDEAVAVGGPDVEPEQLPRRRPQTLQRCGDPGGIQPLGAPQAHPQPDLARGRRLGCRTGRGRLLGTVTPRGTLPPLLPLAASGALLPSGALAPLLAARPLTPLLAAFPLTPPPPPPPAGARLLP